MIKRILSGLAAVAICATSAAATYTPGLLPDGFGGGSVPADPLALKDERKAAGHGGHYFGQVTRCYSTGANNVANGKPDGVDACIEKATTSYEGKLAKLLYLPDCFDIDAEAAAYADEAQGHNPTTYCAPSPSGAFLDTATF